MKIDYDKIAKGWLKILKDIDEISDENNLTIIKYGMIPHARFKSLIQMIKEKIAKDFSQPGRLLENIEIDKITNSFKKDFIAEIEHKMSVAIYKNAKMIV